MKSNDNKLVKLSPLLYIVKKLRISKVDLAKYLNVSQSTITVWDKRGKINYSKLPMILELAKKFNIELTADEIVNGGYIDEIY